MQNVINNARVKEHWNCENLLKFSYLNHKLIQMVPLKQEIIDFIDLGFVLYAVSAILENWPIDPIFVRSQYTNILHVGLCVGAYKDDNDVLFDTEYTVSNLNITMSARKVC